MAAKKKMPWGKHKGRRLSKVPTGYFVWMLAQPWSDHHEAIRDYALRRLAAEGVAVPAKAAPIIKFGSVFRSEWIGDAVIPDSDQAVAPF